MEVNTKNLRILTDYMKTLSPGYEKFDMQYFFIVGDDYETELVQHINVCGTSACFLGHGPAAGILPKKDESWCDYMEREFGVVPWSPEFDYLFGSGWGNDEETATIQAAIDRAETFLELGRIPDDY